MSKLIKNPGSKEAIKLGCTCPVLDNNNGAGIGDGKFWYSGDCSYHQQYPIVLDNPPTHNKSKSTREKKQNGGFNKPR